jgi:subtilisin family serine protease
MSAVSLQSQLTQLCSDSDAAARQRRDLRSLVSDHDLAERVIDELISRRSGLVDEPGRSATRVAVQRMPVSGDMVALAAAGELLIVGAGCKSAMLLLRRRGFMVAGTAGPVTRLVCRSASAAEVMATCGALQDLGVIAGPNYVTAVAPIIKGILGLAGPQPTSHFLADRAAGDSRGAGIRVAVIDTGIDTDAVSASHGWLDGIDIDDSPEGNRDLLDAVPAPDGFLDEAAGHGTFVAGIVRQGAPACEVIAIKAMDSDGLGTDFSVADALFRLAEASSAPDLVNLSLACLASEEIAPVAIDAALEALSQRHPDTLVVAAAGNDGSTAPTWPAASKSVLSVGARDGARAAAYSNTGYWVDFFVPADGVVSTYVQGLRQMSSASGQSEQIEYGGRYAAWSGTSFAAPQVTGLLAALRSDGLSPSCAVAELKRQSVRTSAGGRMLGSPQTPDTV